MRGLTLTLALSLGAHVAIATVLLAPHRSARAQGTSPDLTGDTFELPVPESAGESTPAAVAATSDPPAPVSPAVDTASAADDRAEAPAKPRARPRDRTRAGKTAATTTATSEGGEASTGSAARYGAVGDRSAVDLATAFTRGFPQTASADPIWRTAPLGSAGSADVVLTLSDAGRIEGTDIVGAASPALASAVQRVVALLRTRPFVARGRTTRLHVTATVTSDAVHDGLHGDVFALGGSFASGEGNAFFALAMGRRIDLRVHQR